MIKTILVVMAVYIFLENFFWVIGIINFNDSHPYNKKSLWLPGTMFLLSTIAWYMLLVGVDVYLADTSIAMRLFMTAAWTIVSIRRIVIGIVSVPIVVLGLILRTESDYRTHLRDICDSIVNIAIILMMIQTLF